MSVAIPSLRGAIAVPGWAKNELWRKAQAVPSLDLRFADFKSLVDATTGTNLVTFTRASGGTYVGSDGLIKTAATDEPRFDHDPTTGESLGLLVEEQRVNFILNSSPATTGFALGGAVADTVSGVLAPDGQLYTVRRVTYPSTGAWRFGDTVSGTAGTTYTGSVWMKTESGTANMLLDVNDATQKPVTVTQNWQRLDATGVHATDPYRFFDISGGTGQVILFWGAQLEEGSEPSSYIPAEGSQVTRAASLADLINSAIANNIRSFYVEFRSPASGACGVVSLNDSTANERAAVITSGTDPKLVVVDGGATQADIDAGTVTAGVRTRAAVRIGANDFAISINGGAVVTDTSGTLPAVDRLMIGRTQAGEYLNGTIARCTGWAESLADSALQSLTQ